MSNDTHFFCEHCNNAVNISADACPYCGAIFSGVRCPSCNYSASAKEFLGGCPQCGYIQITNGQGTGGKKTGLGMPVVVAIIVILLLSTVGLTLWYKSLL